MNVKHLSWLSYAVPYGAAGLGAWIFMQIGFPVAPLTGAAVAVSVVCVLGAKVSIAARVRDGLLLLIGINIGSAVSPEALSAAATWPMSIAILTLAMAFSMAFSGLGLVKWFAFDAKSAFLATCPGHLSFVLGMAHDENLEIAPIAIAQSIRVLAITICVPLLLGKAAPQMAQDPIALSLWHLSIMVVLSFGVALGFGALRFPAPYLLAGMAISGVGHGVGVTEGQLPMPMLNICLMGMGLLIGSRFAGARGHSLRNGLWAGLWITMINGLSTGVAVVIAAAVLSVSMPLLMAAYAPGGIEAMAAISMILGLSPTFVAAHHVARLAILSVMIPLAYKFIFDRSAPRQD